jgi:hypothetical protein
MKSILRFSASERINESLTQSCLFSLRKMQKLIEQHAKIQQTDDSALINGDSESRMYRFYSGPEGPTKHMDTIFSRLLKTCKWCMVF